MRRRSVGGESRAPGFVRPRRPASASGLGRRAGRRCLVPWRAPARRRPRAWPRAPRRACAPGSARGRASSRSVLDLGPELGCISSGSTSVWNRSRPRRPGPRGRSGGSGSCDRSPRKRVMPTGRGTRPPSGRRARGPRPGCWRTISALVEPGPVGRVDRRCRTCGGPSRPASGGPSRARGTRGPATGRPSGATATAFSLRNSSRSSRPNSNSSPSLLGDTS